MPMLEKQTVLAALCKALRTNSVFNPEVQAAPVCILWPDRDRQWEAVIPRLQMELPELVVLGDYAPEKRIGPAIWLRCVIAKKTDDLSLPENLSPIFYLPGVSRQDLRAVENCPDSLKPLAELQYRGVIWSQHNAKDWTILAFLKSDQGGLGLDVAQDNDAKNAMQLALYRLLDEEIELLKNKKLDKDYFNKLLTGGDPVRDLLQWLDQGDAFQNGRGENEWKAFVEVCKSQLAFNPAKDGVLAGAVKLATHEGPWRGVWERFCEAPRLYPNIPTRIRQCPMPPLDLFSNAASHGSWPQWNDNAESSLGKELKHLENLPIHKTRSQLLDLEKKHAERRKLVWVELEEAPLAFALAHLAVLAKITENSLTAGNIDDLTAGYVNSGWFADDAVMQALSCVSKTKDVDAVSMAIRALYLPWAGAAATYLQKIVDQCAYPGGSIEKAKLSPYAEGECVFFVDGLRFDAAKRLSEKLGEAGCLVAENPVWAALPSITATGKPAVSPVKKKIIGMETNTDFEPSVKESGQSLKGGYHFKKLLKDSEWEVIDAKTFGDKKSHGWTEFGNIDHEGHERGWKLSKFLDGFLNEIRDRITQLMEAGWKSVRVVTDHGWILVPGGLPKDELPNALTDNKWGRCAIIKPGAIIKEQIYPWYWNPNQQMAMAHGISCFRNGLEYSHGGLSLQECLTLELCVSDSVQFRRPNSINFTDVVWKGLRCNVAVEGQSPDLSLDIRLQAGDPGSSVVVGIKPLKGSGTSSVVIENEEFDGKAAMIVLIDSKGELVGQVPTVIGGEGK
jgi:hypothetical protein